MKCLSSLKYFPSLVLASSLLLLSMHPVFAQSTLNPPKANAPFTLAAADTTLKPMGTLIASDNRLTNFRDLIQQAELESVLNAYGAFTVFAPSNKALADLPKKVLNQLKDDVKYRKNFILSHIFPGKMSSDFLKQTDTIRALSTRNIMLVNDEKNFLINNSPLMASDINASNGVIHIVSGAFLTE